MSVLSKQFQNSLFFVLCPFNTTVGKEGGFITRFLTVLSDKILSVFHYYDQD